MSTSDNSLFTNQLPISLDVDKDDEEFSSILLLYLRRVANAVNTKENGLYLLQETANFEQWYQIANPGQNRNAYRLTADLILLNGGNISTGSTSLTLSTSTQPIKINGYLYPVQGFGGALDTSGISYFLNDPSVYVRYKSSTNTITIVNNSGNALTWCVWVMEYLKN